MSHMTGLIKETIKSGQSLDRIPAPTPDLVLGTSGVFAAWVYLVRVGSIYKIGYARRLKPRMNAMKFQEGQSVHLMAARKVPDAVSAEMWWQWKFRHSFVRSEHFDLSPGEIKEFMSWCFDAPEGHRALGPQNDHAKSWRG